MDDEHLSHARGLSFPPSSVNPTHPFCIPTRPPFTPFFFLRWSQVHPTLSRTHFTAHMHVQPCQPTTRTRLVHTDGTHVIFPRRTGFRLVIGYDREGADGGWHINILCPFPPLQGVSQVAALPPTATLGETLNSVPSFRNAHLPMIAISHFVQTQEKVYNTYPSFDETR